MERCAVNILAKTLAALGRAVGPVFYISPMTLTGRPLKLATNFLLDKVTAMNNCPPSTASCLLLMQKLYSSRAGAGASETKALDS